MMDYSTLSDFEINKLIAEKKGVKGFHCENVGGGSALLFSNWKELDYCNNPGDAWPIIVENRIRVNPVLYTKWMAEDYLEDFSSMGENPLRAAMEVFLMMNEEM